MKLCDIKKGQSATIQSIPDNKVRAHAFRFGFSQGEKIECLERLKKGPVIVKKNFQEIALGRHLAEHITVTPQE